MIDTLSDNKDSCDSGKAFAVPGAVTENADQARKESEANLQFALSAAKLGIWNMDPQTGEIYFDKRCRELYGNPSEDTLHFESLLNYIHFEDREKVTEAIADALDPDKRSVYNIRYRTIGATDKKLRWLHCTGQAYFDANGKPHRFAGVSRNLTEAVVSRERVAWADQQAAMTIEGSGAGSFLVNPVTDELVYSPSMARILTGESGKNVTRDIFIDHIHPDDVEIRTQAYQNAGKTGDLNFEARFIWDDGSVHWIRVIGKYLQESSGKNTSLSGIVMDITDRIESENRLRASEERYRQLASELEVRVQERTEELHQANQELLNSNNNLQQFAYAASHDMQEPLRKIQSFSSRLQTVYSNLLDENGAFMLNRIQDATKRMSSMIDDLLAFSRLTTRDSSFEAVAMDKIITAVIADLEVSIEEQHSEIKVGPLPVLWGNASQLTQLMQNLLSNAIKYRKQDVHSVIEIQSREASNEEIAGLPRLLSDRAYVRLEVRDNGIGFDEKYLDRIFQMFQRLHGRGEFSGSGIGLSLCKKVVENHHGYITAKSEIGKGSEFIVYLPLP